MRRRLAEVLLARKPGSELLMAYNKTKLVESAQKYLNQGKIAQAIAEYERILRHEPRDQITLMTVGDLYVRQGETFQAVGYFERLAQLYLTDGFVTKAIAIYKKIAKLAPEETRPLEHLAELYVHQGVLSEARPLYLQLAEAHLKVNRHPQAVALLRRLLEAEPDNLRVQSRLAELYQAISQPKEAAEAYLSLAQRLLERGEHAEATKVAERALKIDPSHAGAITLKARALVATGKHTDVIALLENLSGLESSTEAAALLTEQYLRAGQGERAAALARRVFETNGDSYELAYKVSTALVEAGELDRALELLDAIRKAMIDAGDQERLAQALNGAAQHVPGRLEPLEWLVDLYGRSNDTFHLPDALAQLGEAAAATGQLERAKQAYQQLLDRYPGDEAAWRCLNQVRVKMGLEPVEEPPAPAGDAAKPAAKETRPTTVIAEPELDEETERYVTQALTEVDLFSSYGLAQKAIDLLEAVLERVPGHAVTLEKLLDLYLGAGNERRTAELAAQLEQICLGRSDTWNAERFAELRQRFQRAAGLAPEELAAATQAAQPEEYTPPMVEAEPVPATENPPVTDVEAATLGEAVVHEVDLSEEWAALAHQEDAVARMAMESAVPAPEVEVRAEAGAEPVADYVLELDAGSTDAGQVASAASSTMSSDQFLTELATEFEELKPSPPPEAPTPAGVPAPQQADSVAAGPLSEVFDEFRAELGELGTEDEDPETHYNLGIAYREMGLLEEAIGEFQKVAQASSTGRAFRYAMQCCTLLGLAFMEKGQPHIAAMWYQRALETPGLDQESILALRYDLGVAQEQAGNHEAALESFSQVYAMNIDYRDVAERIAALGKRR